MTTLTKTILVADDDAAILESIQLLLEINNYSVIITTGEDVIQLIKKHKPDLVLLDIWMGMVDGKEVCRKIKADPKIGDIPIIMLSASNEIEKTFQETGASDYVEKPFDIDVLIEKIESLTN